MKKTIVHVVDYYGEIQLMVDCPHCNRRPILGEEDTFCEFCMNEIEQLNIQAWSEYDNDAPTLVIS